MNQMFNGHATGTDLLEVPTIYKAYFLGNIPAKYGQAYGTMWGPQDI